MQLLTGRCGVVRGTVTTSRYLLQHKRKLQQIPGHPRWLGRQEIAAFGVETMSPGVIDVSNNEVHHICGELGFTHYENMINLYQLIGRGRFRFVGLPLKIRGGTGSPVRAIAVFAGPTDA